jgi:hypothetical protein
MSKLKEACSILANPDMNSQKVVTGCFFAFSDLVFLSVLDNARCIRFSSSESSAIGLLSYSWTTSQPKSDESASLINPIADDSEDEKRMHRALSKTERKTKSEKAKKHPITTSYNKERSAAEDNAGKYKPGRCYTFGKRGHWSDNCPDSKNSKVNIMK